MTTDDTAANRPVSIARPTWMKVLMALLAVPNVATGLWAVISPQSWFDSFPGWAPELVAAHPPYNEHLAFDAGAGLLATGMVMLVALAWPRAEVAVTASIAYIAFALPHTLWHLANPAAVMADSENLVNSVSLGLGVIGAIAVLMWHWARRPSS